MTITSGDVPPRARSLLLHPVPILALVVLALNDHVLKAAVPGVLTGKLSDFAGLLVFPLLLAEAASGVSRRFGRGLEARTLVPAMAAMTAVVFSAVKLSPAAAGTWAASASALQWMLGLGWLRGLMPSSVEVVVDATDLVALPAVLLAAAVASRSGVGALAQQRSGAPHRMLALAVAALTALASIASQPSSTDVSSSIDERFDLTTSFVAARHVTWTVGAKAGEPIQTPTEALRDLALRVTVGRPFEFFPSSTCQGGTLAGIDVRIIPDDADLGGPIHDPRDRGCEPVAIDLGERCASGCTGGATILVENAADPDYHVDSTAIYADLGGLSYSDRHLPVELVWDPAPGEAASAARATSGELTYAFDVGPGRLDTTLDAVLHVPAALLQEPLDRLYGTLRVNFQSVDVKSGFGTNQTLTVGSIEPFTVDAYGGANVEIDWLSQCRAGQDCDIPVTLDVRTTRLPPNASGVDSGARPDYYRWNVESILVALDGRTLPPEPIEIDGPSDPIIEPAPVLTPPPGGAGRSSTPTR